MGRRMVLTAEMLAIVAAVTGCAAAHAASDSPETLAPAPEVRATVHAEPGDPGPGPEWQPVHDW